MSGRKMVRIQVHPGRTTIINFPVKPTKVIMGNPRAFKTEYIENDLAVAALLAPSTSNMFVYLNGRRFGFNLRTTHKFGDTIVKVRDTNSDSVKVEWYE